MSIIHTLRRRSQSRRRHQEAVLQAARKPEAWVESALHHMAQVGGAERLWNSWITKEEKEAFKKKKLEEKIEVLNMLLHRVNVLRFSCDGFTGKVEYVHRGGLILAQATSNKPGEQYLDV